MGPLKGLWEKWKAIAHKIGDFQARLLLSVFYFLIFGPFAVGVKLFSDPLRLGPSCPGGWMPRPSPEGDASTIAMRQF